MITVKHYGSWVKGKKKSKLRNSRHMTLSKYGYEATIYTIMSGDDKPVQWAKTMIERLGGQFDGVLLNENNMDGETGYRLYIKPWVEVINFDQE